MMKQKLNKRNKAVEHSLTTYSGCSCSNICSCACHTAALQARETQIEIGRDRDAMQIIQMR